MKNHIYYAPVLPAEQWTSIDCYCRNYEQAVSKYAPELQVTSLLPSTDVEMNPWIKRVKRDFIYPTDVKSAFRQSPTTALLHVFDHAYAHLCQYATKSVLHCHDLNHFVEPSLTGLRLKRWKKRVMGMKKADHVIAISHQLSEEIQKYIGISEDKISIVYNGLDHDIFHTGLKGQAFARYPELATLAKGHFLILNVGTNLERKNLNTLYESVALLKQNGQKVKLIRAGSNASRADEDTLIESYGITDDVIQMGVVSTTDLALLYNLCDVLSFASLYEGFGWPLVEAQACGLPVVAANNSCIPEIAGKGALYHEPKSAEDLSYCLLQVKDKPKETLLELGYQNCQRFSWEQHVNALQECYLRV